jgi:hypothetical protein
MLSLELIDAGLILARRRAEETSILAEAPGVALLEEERTLTGEAAARRLRVKPLLAQTNFWRTLSTAPLTRPSRLIQTSADLAYAQAESLLRGHDDGDGMLLAVPAGYSREQLGLLLGVINETGVRVAGLVDAALAACSLQPAPARLLHLDLELHQALLTVLEYTGGERPGLKRSRYEILLQHGLLAIQQTWMHFIAEQFVRKTRFDPLHDAANEQLLFDRLPEWLATFAHEERAVLETTFGGSKLEVEIERAQLIAAVERHYAQLQSLVQSARVAGMPIELRVSHRVAALPGLLDRLQALRDCRVEVLERGAAALGALHHAAAIARPVDALALVYHLPVAAATGEATESSEQHIEATPPALRPTHVLYQGRAWRITDVPLVVGWAVEHAPRALVLPAPGPGISRKHCSLLRRNGAVVIEDHSTYGSYVNDERVVGRTTLTVGDRVRLGSPGVTLEMIQLVNDDGAPQD